MYVAVSTICYPELSLSDCLERLTDLEFSTAEIAIHEHGGHLRPSAVADDLEASINACLMSHRLGLSGFSVQIDAEGEEHYRQFEACCKLAKATKAVSLTIPSAELGTPFNEEVEHLRRLVGIASTDGVIVSIRSQIGRLSEDPDTVMVLCDNVKGLGLTLDPSHYVAGPYRNRGYEKILKYVYNVYLRDSKRDALQVRIGQGEIDYSRLINQLSREKYQRSLTVHIEPTPEIEQAGELRKLRLLLESLL